MPMVIVKHTTAQLRSETFSLHNHSVKETERFTGSLRILT